MATGWSKIIQFYFIFLEKITGILIRFCFVLFLFFVFVFVLFYFVLFGSFLFCFVSFYFALFFVLFYFVFCIITICWRKKLNNINPVTSNLRLVWNTPKIGTSMTHANRHRKSEFLRQERKTNLMAPCSNATT